MNNFSSTHWILLTVLSLGLVAISWQSLKNPRSHGYYRFFAWETILVLFLLNAEFWFHDPLSWNQIIAWSLLLLSLVPLTFGIHSLRTRGKPAKQRKDDPSLLAFEKTTTLVTTGIYRYIRHPLYSSLLLLAWGILAKAPSLIGAVLSMLCSVFLLLTAKADEAECVRFFGAEYSQYMKNTKRFIPYVF